MLRQEIIKRPIDETACDGCGCLLRVADPVLVDLEHGTVYCNGPCARRDAEAHGYPEPTITNA